jgi:hypothetical protein
VAQKEPEDIAEKLLNLSLFLTNVLIAHPNINPDLIINMDETPVYMDMVGNTTLAKRGEKEVLIQTTGHEKQRMTVVLAVTLSGKKLRPMIIFKGADSKDGRILREFKDRAKYTLFFFVVVVAVVASYSVCFFFSFI